MLKKIVVVLFLFLTVFLVMKSFWPLPQEPFPQTEISEITETKHSPQPVAQEEPKPSEDVQPAIPEPKKTNVKVIHVDFDQARGSSTPTAGSVFSKSYKLALENLELTAAPQTFQIAFDRDVADVTSVVIMGATGESQITQLKFNDKNSELDKETKTLFENDWHRSANSFTSLKNIEFVASSKDKGLINIYLQVMGEE